MNILPSKDYKHNRESTPGTPSYMQFPEPDIEEDERQAPPREGLKNVVSTILILIAAPLIALSLTTFVFQSYEVDGDSMRTTLEDNDRLIVLKLPRTWAKISGKPYIPARGDIIVFTKPGSLELGDRQDKQLIKRVIALPGERVTINGGLVTVFNSDNPDGFQPDKSMPYGSAIGNTPGNDIDETVPADEVYVLGDNRSNSQDSRYFGTVHNKDIVGKLALRLLPLSKIDSF